MMHPQEISELHRSSDAPIVESLSFLSLAGEVRNKIYEMALLRTNPIDPWNLFWEHLTPGLLRSNQAIHREASSVLYGRNIFDFTTAESDDIVSFLEQIGSKNAGHIRHMLIEFPSFLHLDPEEVTLEHDAVRMLEHMQQACSNLSNITTSLSSTDSMEVRLDNLENHKVATDALELVNTHFQNIPSLQKITVEVYEDGGSYQLRRTMEKYGWILGLNERVEEDWDWDRSFSDGDDDGDDDYLDRYGHRYGYGYGSDDADDYDIDKDSDFWRRAAD